MNDTNRSAAATRVIVIAVLVAAGLAVAVWSGNRTGPAAATESASTAAASAEPAPPRRSGDAPVSAPARPVESGSAGVAAGTAGATAGTAGATARHNQVIADIRSSFAAGHYAAVVQQATAALEGEPDRDDVRAFLVMAACALGDGDVARREHAKLRPARQEFTARRCATSGMTL